MRVLKTIVATVVIVFTLTTVAMAGVQHFTKQSGQTAAVQTQLAQSAGAQAQPAQRAAAPAQQVRQTQQVQQAQRAQLNQSQSQLTAARSMEQQARHVYSQRHTERATMGIRDGSTMGIRASSSGTCQ
ncbi:MAG: hypothetical protein ACLQUT_09535 [Thermoleophilia bacterium]